MTDIVSFTNNQFIPIGIPCPYQINESILNVWVVGYFKVHSVT